MTHLRAHRRNLWRASKRTWSEFRTVDPETRWAPQPKPIARISKKMLKRYYRGPFRRLESLRGEISYR